MTKKTLKRLGGTGMLLVSGLVYVAVFFLVAGSYLLDYASQAGRKVRRRF